VIGRCIANPNASLLEVGSWIGNFIMMTSNKKWHCHARPHFFHCYHHLHRLEVSFWLLGSSFFLSDKDCVCVWQPILKPIAPWSFVFRIFFMWFLWLATYFRDHKKKSCFFHVASLASSLFFGMHSLELCFSCVFLASHSLGACVKFFFFLELLKVWRGVRREEWWWWL
jgi:hypothetical protein